MNRDPFGLGVHLYGLAPAPVSPVGVRTLIAMGAMSMTLIPDAHDDCSIATFCRNPLHPGPCAGWKKKLGVEAPGALHAIESAHKAKVAANRVKRAEAKSAAAKTLTSRHHASPLRAKKALTKRANMLLGNDEAKASSKADKVILNKGEIAKYSKIKAAQINSFRTKHGLEEDPGLEDRLKDALALDNKGGKDDHYRAAIDVSGASLGTQLAQKHCKKGDGDCDGKPYEELRDEFIISATAALLTGDDGHIDTLIEDYDAGDFKPAGIAQAKKIAAEMKAAQEEKAKAAQLAENKGKAAQMMGEAKTKVDQMAKDKAAKEQAKADNKAKAAAMMDAAKAKADQVTAPKPAPAAPAKAPKGKVAAGDVAVGDKLISDGYAPYATVSGKVSTVAKIEKIPDPAHPGKHWIRLLDENGDAIASGPEDDFVKKAPPAASPKKAKAEPAQLEGNAAKADAGMKFGLGLLQFIKGNKTLGSKATQKDFADKIQAHLDGDPKKAETIAQAANLMADTLLTKVASASMAKPYLSLHTSEKNAAKLAMIEEIAKGLKGEDGPTPMVDAFKEALTAQNGYDFAGTKAAEAKVKGAIAAKAATDLGLPADTPPAVLAAKIVFKPGSNWKDGKTGQRVGVLNAMTPDEFAQLDDAEKKEVADWLENRAKALDTSADDADFASVTAYAKMIELQQKFGLPEHTPEHDWGTTPQHVQDLKDAIATDSPPYQIKQAAEKLSPAEKQSLTPDEQAKLEKALAAPAPKPFDPDATGPGEVVTESGKVVDLHELFSDEGFADADHQQVVEAVTAMTQDDYDALAPWEQGNLKAHVTDADSAGEPGAESAFLKAVAFENNTPSGGAPAAAPAPAAGQPVDVSSWKKVGGQGGSNLGAMYEAPDGTRYYVKSLKSPDHVKSEVLAASLYKAAGIDVPDVSPGANHPDGWKNVIVSKLLPDAKKAKADLTGGGAFQKNAQDGYAVDAWLANYDTVGLAHDNIVDSNGKPVRIDVGGSLEYRAQGNKKTDWGDDPNVALKGLKDPSKNAQAASVFGSMTPEQEKASAQHLSGVSDEQIDQLVADSGMPPSMAATLKARKKAILAKYGLDESTPAPTAAPSAPTPAASLSADAKAASAYANGFKSGTAKVKLAAYEKVSGEEFQQMLPNTQQLILADLKAIEGKFVAPAKKKQAKDHHDYLASHVGTNIPAAGPGPSAPSAPTGAPSDAEKLNAAGKTLTEMINLVGDAPDPDKAAKAGVGIMQKAQENGSFDQLAEQMGFFQSDVNLEKLAKKHGLNPGEIADVKPKLAEEITKKLQADPGPTPVYDAWVKAMQSGTSDDLNKLIDTAGGTAPTPVHAPASNADVQHLKGNTAMVLMDAWHDHPDAGAVSAGSIDKEVKAALSDGIGSPKHQTWAKHTAEDAAAITLDTAYTHMDWDTSQIDAIPTKISNDAADVLAADYEKSLLSTEPYDGGKPAAYLKNAVTEINAASNKIATENGWDINSPQIQQYGQAVWQAKLENLPKMFPVAAPSGHAHVAPAPPPHATPHPIGHGTSLDDVDPDTQKEILANLKGLPTGKYLKDPKEQVYGNLLALASAHGTADKPLSVLQVLKSIDSAFSKQLGVPNSNKWENDFKAWMATPEGKAFIAANRKPDADLVKKFVVHYEGISTDLAELAKKVKLQPGPGEFDAAKPSSDFKVIQKAKANQLGAQMLADQHGTFTPTQLEGIKVYTGSSYTSMNKWLRGETSTISAHHKDAITKTQDAMRPLPQDVLLHRGVYWDALPNGVTSYAGAKKLIGETLMDEAFMSSSIGGNPGLGAGRPVIYEIEAPKGTQAAWVEGNSTNNGEREMLLGAGQHFKILGVEQVGSQVHIRMRIVTPKDGHYAA